MTSIVNCSALINLIVKVSFIDHRMKYNSTERNELDEVFKRDIPHRSRYCNQYYFVTIKIYNVKENYCR